MRTYSEDPEISSRIKTARRMADAASNITLGWFRKALDTSNKGDASSYDPVTQADRNAEEVMLSLLAKDWPDDAVEGEEFGSRSGTSGFTWYLDPIDGTRAYVAGLTSWTTLIGLVRNDEPVAGLIDQPWLGERYIGWTEGAALEQRGDVLSLKVSSVSTLTQAVLATTDPFIFTASERGGFEHIRATARITRYGLDAYAYARLAGGSMDIVVEAGLQPYDIAALVPVIRGAGGIAADWRGKPAKLGPQLIAVAHPDLLDAAVLSLKRSAV